MPRNGAAQKSHVLPVDVHPQRKRFESDRRSIGASGDSYYEYLLKGWLVARRGDDRPWARSLLQRYTAASGSILKEMVGRSKASGGKASVAWLGSRASVTAGLGKSMEHLACFAPGMLALGAATGEAALQHHLPIARELMATCRGMYTATRSGLAAELSEVDSRGQIKAAASGYQAAGLLRPEASESLFLLYRLTGDETYRAWGWEIFQAIEKHARRPDSGAKLPRGSS